MMDIRNAGFNDFDGVYSLLKQLWPDTAQDEQKMREVYSKAIARENDFAIAAVLDGNVVGFCSGLIATSLWQCGDGCYISALIVDEAHRNKRIGAALMQAAEELAVRRGCRSMELDSALHREAAHRFYENLGFARMGYAFSKQL